MLASAFVDTLFSILLAPLLLYFYTKFVLLSLVGARVVWKTQNRSTSGIPLADALRMFGETSLVGLLATATAAIWVPALLMWLAPVLVGLVLAVPLAMLTSSDRIGQWLRRTGLLLTPEEINVPPILQNLDAAATSATSGTHSGLLHVALSPAANSVHIAMLRRSKVKTRYKESYLDQLRSRLLTDGPDSLTRRELLALLWDAEAVTALHRELWQAPENRIHPWWSTNMRQFNVTSSIEARELPTG